MGRPGSSLVTREAGRNASRAIVRRSQSEAAEHWNEFRSRLGRDEDELNVYWTNEASVRRGRGHGRGPGQWLVGPTGVGRHRSNAWAQSRTGPRRSRERRVGASTGTAKFVTVEDPAPEPQLGPGRGSINSAGAKARLTGSLDSLAPDRNSKQAVLGSRIHHETEADHLILSVGCGSACA